MLAIANARGIPGTASALVRDERGASYVLANHHVIYGGGAQRGEPVWALPPDDGAPPIELGRAGAGQLGRVGSSDAACFVDCALVELQPDPARPAWLATALGGLARLRGTAAATTGLAVRKHGATTGLTHGIVASTAYTDQPELEGKHWIASGQLLVESRDAELNFSARGDSGAAIVDDADRLVGLLWGATDYGQGIACPIAPILDCLAVSLVEVR